MSDLRTSTLSINSEFRDRAESPASNDFIVYTGYTGGNTNMRGAPEFHGIHSLGLLDTTVVNVISDGPIKTTVDPAGYAVGDATIPLASTAEFPDTGVVYNVDTREQMAYSGKTATDLTGVSRAFNGSGALAGGGGQAIVLVGDPYLYVRLSEPSIGYLDAMTVTTADGTTHDKFFAKIPVENTRPDQQVYFNHDAKWNTWTAHGFAYPYLGRIRVEVFRAYGGRMYPYSTWAPFNMTLRIKSNPSRRWNQGVVSDAELTDEEW